MKKQPSDQQYPYVYSSSELGKYFGITIKGIEYYEKKGLIKPSRVGNNKQRRFDLMETYRIWMTRYLRQTGFNIDQTLTILNAQRPATAEKSFEEMIAALQRKQLKLDATVAVLQRHLELLKQLDAGPYFQLEQSPHYQWLFLRSMEKAHQSDAQQSKEYLQWNELMPITDASIRYGQDAINTGQVDLEPEIGMLITNDYFEKFGLAASDRVVSVPSRDCLHTILVGDSQQIKRREWLQPALDVIQARRLHLSGDVVTSLLLVLDNDETHLRFDEAWLPVG